MTTEPCSTPRRTDIRAIPNHGSWRDIYHVLEVPLGSPTFDECEADCCTRENELQFVESLEGDIRVYCSTHCDRDRWVKIR